MNEYTRRTFVRTAAVAPGIVLAGCATGASTDTPADRNGGGDGVTEVAAGPNSSPVFDPEEVTIAVDETVRWTFESPSHNVSCVPDHSDSAVLPDGAEPFASYEGDDRFETLPAGETYEHAFETPGEYVYVCIPHEASGMIGTVVVE